MTDSHDTTAAYERALARVRSEKVELQLFIAGMGPRSTQAVADVEELRKAYGDRCSVEIVDIYDDPSAAAASQVVAVPALVRHSPLPMRRLIGAIGNIVEAARSLGLPAQLPSERA
jgi:circadian clock protein KaiB